MGLGASGRWDWGRGPPGGAGDHQTLHDPRLLPGGSAERSWSLARPRLAALGQGRPPTPLPSTPPDPPAPGGHTRPTGPACRLLSLPPGSSPQRCPGTLSPKPGGPAPRSLRSLRGEEARRARRQLEGGRPGGHGGGGSGADRVSHLSSWPRRSRGRRDLSRSASSSCFMEPCTWVGAPERSGPRAGQTRGADGAGPRRPAGGGRRRKRRGGGSGRKELLKVFPGAAGGLSRAGTRVFRYPSSHRRQ